MLVCLQKIFVHENHEKTRKKKSVHFSCGFVLLSVDFLFLVNVFLSIASVSFQSLRCHLSSRPEGGILSEKKGI
uniref:Uncharacterized protein n=1 Tax=Candidatus Kentrum sp. FW TaxID=2126338 RepID=A0A450TLQ7_9GAMM|nr:MAG: hypothetical protein BECKFW1821B_GA0114236_11484 [Candidatus Kentron sp. FW]